MTARFVEFDLITLTCGWYGSAVKTIFSLQVNGKHMPGRPSLKVFVSDELNTERI